MFTKVRIFNSNELLPIMMISWNTFKEAYGISSDYKFSQPKTFQFFIFYFTIIHSSFSLKLFTDSTISSWLSCFLVNYVILSVFLTTAIFFIISFFHKTWNCKCFSSVTFHYISKCLFNRFLTFTDIRETEKWLKGSLKLS